ncbi:MAG: hypothetical protein V1836_03635 [Candidatus Aenigmatarchaeota archaeon]
MPSDNVRFMFWIAIALMFMLVFFGIANILLPRLIIYSQLPDTERSLYSDSGDEAALRIVNGVCNLWNAKVSFDSGFESVVDYRITSGSAGETQIGVKFSSVCPEIGDHWRYAGVTMSAENTYEVRITLDSGTSKIIINVKKK